MPPRPSWLLRTPEIAAALRDFPAPVVDRAAFERLFEVKRWQACRLMRRFGGWQAGRTALVERDALLAELERIAAGEAFDWERRRRQRVVEELEKNRKRLRGAAVRLTVSPAPPPSLLDIEGVEIDGGRLTVAFSGAEDLLTKLYRVAQAAAEDMNGFRRAVEPPQL